MTRIEPIKAFCCNFGIISSEILLSNNFDIYVTKEFVTKPVAPRTIGTTSYE